MAPCKKCERLDRELISEKENYKKLVLQYENESNTENVNSRICCIEMKKEITKKENTITELTLQVGKQAANDDKIIKELKKERDVVNAKNTTLTEELNELKKQNQTNLRSIERLENEKKREVDDLNDKLRKRNGDIDKVNSEKSNLDFERRQLEEKVQTLERELRTKSTAIDDANDEIANMKSTIDNWQMEYNTNTNELENHYQTQMQQFDQHLRDCNDEITSLRNRLENNVEEKRQYEKQHNLDLTNLKEANTEKSKLQQENIELKKMLEDNSNAEDTMLSQIAQYNRETDNLNLSLNQSFEKIKNLELCLATPNLRFINLNQAFKNYTRGQNVKIGDDNSLREILLYSYPEIFPDPDLSQNTETGCIPNENLLSGQQNIVLSVAKLVYSSANEWRIYATTKEGENPIKNNIVETLKKYRFQLQINDELKCRGQELQKIIKYIYKCDISKLHLSGDFHSENDNYKIVFSKNIKHAIFNTFGVIDENKKEIEISEILKELSNLETIEWWITPGENFVKVPGFPKLREFKLRIYSDNFNTNDFSEFIKKHQNQHVKFIFQLRHNLRDDIKQKFQKEIEIIRATLPSTCLLSVEYLDEKIQHEKNQQMKVLFCS